MKSKHIHIDYEGVAVPEIEFDGDDDELTELLDPDSDCEIDYDEVAIPEIHSSLTHPNVKHSD